MLRLPVSIGEAIDKLTILEIKLEKIKNEGKRHEIIKEYECLQIELKSYLEKCPVHYRQLLKINQSLWNLEDVIRTDLSIEECASVAKQIIYENDSRFRTKDKINNLLSSELREQKAYLFVNCKEVIYNEIYDKYNGEVNKIIEEILDYSVRNNAVKISVNKLLQEGLIRIQEFFKYDECVSFY